MSENQKKRVIGKGRKKERKYDGAMTDKFIYLFIIFTVFF